MPEAPTHRSSSASSGPYLAEVIGWYVGAAGLALGHTVVAQLVLLGCAMYRLVTEPGSRPARLTRPTKAMLALAAWMLCTAVFAWKPANAFGSTIGAMLTGWLVFVATKRAAASGFGARLTRVFLASACAGAAYALIRFGMFVLKHAGTPRAQLPFVGCNTAGTIMAVATIIAIGYASRSVRTMQRLALAACAALTFAALVATQSRGALVAFVAGLAVLAGALVLSRRRRARRAILILTALALLLVAFSAVYPPIRARYATILKPAANQDRLDIWRTAVAIIRDHPLVGVGVNNFRDAYMAYPHARSPVQEQPFAHNVFLEFGAATGVPGLVLVGWVIAAGIANGLYAWKWQMTELGTAEEVPATSLAAFVAVVVHLQFDLSIYSIDMLPLFFIPYAVLAWLAERARAGGKIPHNGKVALQAGNTSENTN
ncbi:MAG: O-antigen ligase family protein [Betaproteobacteria bacterium]